jgi:hypothetical protein
MPILLVRRVLNLPNQVNRMALFHLHLELLVVVVVGCECSILDL